MQRFIGIREHVPTNSLQGRCLGLGYNRLCLSRSSNSSPNKAPLKQISVLSGHICNATGTYFSQTRPGRISLNGWTLVYLKWLAKRTIINHTTDQNHMWHLLWDVFSFCELKWNILSVAQYCACANDWVLSQTPRESSDFNEWRLAVFTRRRDFLSRS